MGLTIQHDRDTEKIDSLATSGLAGVSNSLAYRIHEIERHIHGYERWFETAATPNGGTHVADAIGTGGGAFQLDAGNDGWGAWIQMLGTTDTPAIAGSVYYDPQRILIESTERDATYFLQFGYGATGSAALTAGSYTESIVIPSSNLTDSGPMEVQSRRQTAGTKLWGRTMCPGQNTATIDLYPGIHEYPG